MGNEKGPAIALDDASCMVLNSVIAGKKTDSLYLPFADLEINLLKMEAIDTNGDVWRLQKASDNDRYDRKRPS